MLQLQSTLLIPDIKCITVQLHTVNSIRFIRHVCTHDKDWSCAGSTDTEYACGNATLVPCLVEGQGHQVRRLLMDQVGHGDRVSDLTLRPCRFQASMYSILHSSRSSAESRHHCLQKREQLRRSTQSSCEKTREITSAGARSAAGVARSPSLGGGGGGAMANPLSQEGPVLGLAPRNPGALVFSAFDWSLAFGS